MKKFLIFILSAIMLFGVFPVFACGKEDVPAVVEYTITFDYGEGSGTVSELTVKENEQIGNLPTPSIVPTGKIFAGWKTAGGEIIAEGTMYTFGKNITLFADYSTETYAIVYDAQGGALGAGAINSYSESDSAIVLPTPTKDRYKFIGWIINDGTEAITSLPAGITGNLRLTAVWVKNYFTVYLDNSSSQSLTNWADGTTGIKVIEINVGDTITFPKIEYDDYSKSYKDNHDYCVEGWFYTDKNNDATQLTEQTEFSFETLNIESTVLNVHIKITRIYANYY